MAIRALTVALALLVTVPLSAQQNTAQAIEPSATDYIIGPHDVLMITSYDQGDLTGKFAVETDGTFTFPMLGRVKANGITLREAEAALKSRLVELGLFKNPQLTVTVDQYRSQKVFVLGEVRKPGVYTLSGTMRLVEALALADSMLPTAGSEAVIISTTDDPSPQATQHVVRVNLRDLENGGVSENVVLRDGDTIMVPRAENVYVFGQVKSPGAFALQQNDMTVLQALSLAGGVTDRGSMGRIEIVRIVDNERQELSVELTDVVLAGDTIVVPERFF